MRTLFAKTTHYIGPASSLKKPYWQAPTAIPPPSRHNHPGSWETATYSPDMADEKKRDATIEMGEKMPNGHFEAQPKPATPPSGTAAFASIQNNPMIAILSYCGSSILMTVTNKYVVNGTGFNMNFLLLAVQVCHATLSRE